MKKINLILVTVPLAVVATVSFWAYRHSPTTPSKSFNPIPAKIYSPVKIDSAALPLFLEIPSDWLYKKDPRIVYSAPQQINLNGTLSRTSARERGGSYDYLYFIPNGGTPEDEIVIACDDRELRHCKDEPKAAIWDEQSGKQVLVGFRRELSQLVDDTLTATKRNPDVNLDATIISQNIDRFGIKTNASIGPVTIRLISGVVSEANERSRAYRVNLSAAKLGKTNQPK